MLSALLTRTGQVNGAGLSRHLVWPTRTTNHTQWLQRCSTTQIASRGIGVSIARQYNSAFSPSKPSNVATSTSQKSFQIYFDNVYPIRFSQFDPRFLFYTRKSINNAAGNLRDFILNRSKTAAAEAIAADPDPPVAKDTATSGKSTKQANSGLPFDAQLGDIVPRVKDGGMFITVQYDRPATTDADNSSIDQQIRDEILAAIRDIMQEGPRPWFNLRRSHVYIVRGKPFVEDLTSHYPSTRLRVELFNQDVQTTPRPERIYSAFREYGRIGSIRMPPPTSYFPRSVIIRYSSRRAAAAAKNCVHGYEIPLRGSNDARANFSIQYEPNVKLVKIVINWFSSHPRVTLPLILALAAIVTYTVFDPMREFFIRREAEGTFNFDRYTTGLQQLGDRLAGRASHRRPVSSETNEMQEMSDMDSPTSTTPDMHAWQGRANDEEQLRQWLEEPPSTFIVVDGPPGSGKTEMVNQVLDDHSMYLTIDCDALLSSRSDDEMIEKLARQIGYRPYFQAYVWVSKLIDSMVAATTGADADLSSSARERFKEILGTCSEALECLNDDTYFERLFRRRGTSKKHRILAANKEDSPPERKEYPIIILDGFFNVAGENNDQIWYDLADWASTLVERRIAHVIFVCRNGAAAELPLNRAMPHRSFSTISLRDGGPEVALNYVQNRLGDRAVPVDHLMPCIQALGGRLNDLETFVQKILSGMSPRYALEDIIGRAEAELRKYVVRDPLSSDAALHAGSKSNDGSGNSSGNSNGNDKEASRGKASLMRRSTSNINAASSFNISWSSLQFWHILTLLAEHDSISYDAVRQHALFHGSDVALHAMERADLIHLERRHGRPFAISPAKSIYKIAFQRLQKDTRLVLWMRRRTLAVIRVKELSKVEKCEEELRVLGEVAKGLKQLSVIGERAVRNTLEDRVRAIVMVMQRAGDKVCAYDQEIAEVAQELADLGVPENA
ncbi:RNA12 protein-domain-containing protein [Syncephalis plumigaleata]|nr:RNA12 protein-domain-containing protein [Syncephalis plumigaleata]